MLPAGAHCASTSRILGARASKMATLGASLLLCILQVFQSLGGHASARRVSHEPCFRETKCLVQGPVRFLPALPNPTCARSHIWGFPSLSPLISTSSHPLPQTPFQLIFGVAVDGAEEHFPFSGFVQSFFVGVWPSDSNLVWVLPEDLCNENPCNFNTEMFVSKVGNPYPTLGQLPASRIL